MRTAQKHSTAQTLLDELEGRLTRTGDLSRRLREPSLPAVRASAAVFQLCLRSLAAHAQLPGGVSRAVEHEVLYRSFDSFLAFRAGELARAAALILQLWVATLSVVIEQQRVGERDRLSLVEEDALHFARSLLREIERPPRARPSSGWTLPGGHGESELLVLFHQAVEQVVAPELGAEQGRAALRSLMTRLELGQDDLGRMFGVSGETIRRWERGSAGIPAERRATILAAESGLRRLQDLFRAERLPTVVRRPAELFDGETALAWILRGRIGDVADRYEKTLLYQG